MCHICDSLNICVFCGLSEHKKIKTNAKKNTEKHKQQYILRNRSMKSKKLKLSQQEVYLFPNGQQGKITKFKTNNITTLTHILIYSMVFICSFVLFYVYLFACFMFIYFFVSVCVFARFENAVTYVTINLCL